MDRDCFWLTDEQFAKIAPHCPPTREASLGSMIAA
jgi:hypothetical protein